MGGRARTVFTVMALLSPAACIGDILGVNCTTELRANLVVEVRDAATGAPAAWGTTGFAQHEAGRVTELSAVDSLHLGGNWAREQGGDYRVTLRKPGYQVITRTVEVEENACHVETRRVRMELTPDPGAAPQTFVAFSVGEHVTGWNAAAGITTSGDTLWITGRAYAPCSSLVAVAAWHGSELHVQLQPEAWLYEQCDGEQWLQQFAVAYRLPRGATSLYVTNGFAQPVVLFDGSVVIEATP